MPRRGLTNIPASCPPGTKIPPTFTGAHSASDRIAAEGFADAKQVHSDPGATADLPQAERMDEEKSPRRGTVSVTVGTRVAACEGLLGALMGRGGWRSCEVPGEAPGSSC